MIGVLIIVLGLVVVVPLVAAFDALNFSKPGWRAIRQPRGLWQFAFFLVPFGVGILALLIYVAVIRPKLRDYRMPQTLPTGTRVRITRWPSDGATAAVVAPGVLGQITRWCGMTVLALDGRPGNLVIARDCVVPDET